MNIEDIHCQIVMRRQRNNQILRELEGGESEMFGASHNNLYEQAGETDTFISRHNSVNKQGASLLDRTGEHHNTCIQVKEVEILGPDYCSKRPVFLPLHFPEML